MRKRCGGQVNSPKTDLFGLAARYPVDLLLIVLGDVSLHCLTSTLVAPFIADDADDRNNQGEPPHAPIEARGNAERRQKTADELHPAQPKLYRRQSSFRALMFFGQLMMQIEKYSRTGRSSDCTGNDSGDDAPFKQPAGHIGDHGGSPRNLDNEPGRTRLVVQTLDERATFDLRAAARTRERTGIRFRSPPVNKGGTGLLVLGSPCELRLISLQRRRRFHAQMTARTTDIFRHGNLPWIYSVH